MPIDHRSARLDSDVPARPPHRRVSASLRPWIPPLLLILLYGIVAAAARRSAAAETVLPTDEVNRWFDRTLKDGAGKPLPVRTDNEVTELIDSPETFHAMVRSISHAKGPNSYIYLINWWLSDDMALEPGGGAPILPRLEGGLDGQPLLKEEGGNPATTVLSLLNAASDRGVEIRAMLWAQKSIAWNPSFGVKGQNIKEATHINLMENGAAVWDSRTRPFGSHHQKILIVYDATLGDLVAYCGGMEFNPDRVWPQGTNGVTQAGTPLHDVQCMVRGAAAWDLLQIFRNRWFDHPDVARLPTSPTNKQRLWGFLYPKQPTPAVAPGRQWVQIGHTYPNGLAHGQPGYSFAPNGEQTAGQMILHAIGQARQFIYFEDQYMVDLEASQALVAALTNNPGLRVLILIAPWNVLGLPGPLGGSDIFRNRRQQFMAPLKAFGDRVGIYALHAPGDFHTYVHSKTWIFDDEFAIIGSANCNRRSWSYDSEVMAGICDPGDGVNLRMPHRLRMRLWSEHLGEPLAALTDWKAAMDRWKNPSVAARIVPDDDFYGAVDLGREAGKLGWLKRSAWDQGIDPDGGQPP